MDSVEQMQRAMDAYFSAEKQESLVFVLIGVAALAAATWLLATRHAYRGMAYPLAAVALIQLAVGGAVYLRTDGQVAALQEQLARAPAEYQAAEIARMDKVAAGFGTYKVAEIVLLAAGIAATFAFRRREQLYAAGIGLILQSSVMLVLDLFAEHRADVYIAAIRALESRGVPQ